MADILILSDEIEEFSRFGRPLLSSSYYDTTAEVEVNFKKLKGWIDIESKYDVAEHQEIENFLI